MAFALYLRGFFRTCIHRAKLLDLRENFLQIEKKMCRFAPAKQGFLTKSYKKFTAKATVEPMNTGS
jgi:hypothetical protein